MSWRRCPILFNHGSLQQAISPGFLEVFYYPWNECGRSQSNLFGYAEFQKLGTDGWREGDLSKGQRSEISICGKTRPLVTTSGNKNVFSGNSVVKLNPR